MTTKVQGGAGSVLGGAGSVLGVDGCRAGWVGIVVDVGLAGPPTVWSARSLAELAAAAGPVVVVGVDIPIGLPESSVPRPADLLARKALGPRWPSIFLTPVRAVVEAPTYAEANAMSRELTGAGLSRQAYALRAKILDAASWIDTGVSVPVLEVHPELSFVHMAGEGAPPLASKRTWTGAHQRMCLLRDAGIDLDRALGSAGPSAAVDDVLDAAAVAWTATRVARGSARSFPSPPDRDATGREVAIWA